MATVGGLSSSAFDKWNRLKAGEMVVISDITLNEMDDHFNHLDNSDATLYFKEVASMPHPYRVGTKDTYWAFIYDRLSPSDKKIVDDFLSKSKERQNPMDEDDDDFDLRSEMEDGIVISDRTRGGYDVSAGGKFVDHFGDWDDAIRAVAEHMENEKFWPNVFFVNDHGDVDLLALKYRKGKNGKIGKVTDKIVRSWV